MKIALIAHDRKKSMMVKLATAYKTILEKHELFATGTTGQRITEATGLPIHRFKSGPLGGDRRSANWSNDLGGPVRFGDFSSRPVGCTAA